jgi:hypothetical protein
MARSQFKGRSMGGQESDLTRTLDDAVDEAESLPFRYQNMLVEVELPL